MSNITCKNVKIIDDKIILITKNETANVLLNIKLVPDKFNYLTKQLFLNIKNLFVLNNKYCNYVVNKCSVLYYQNYVVVSKTVKFLNIPSYIYVTRKFSILGTTDYFLPAVSFVRI